MFAAVRKDSATKEELIDFLKKVDRYENLDLDKQRMVARAKLALLRLIEKCLEGRLNLNI